MKIGFAGAIIICAALSGASIWKPENLPNMLPTDPIVWLSVALAIVGIWIATSSHQIAAAASRMELRGLVRELFMLRRDLRGNAHLREWCSWGTVLLCEQSKGLLSVASATDKASFLRELRNMVSDLMDGAGDEKGLAAWAKAGPDRHVARQVLQGCATVASLYSSFPDDAGEEEKLRYEIAKRFGVSAPDSESTISFIERLLAAFPENESDGDREPFEPDWLVSSVAGAN